ncbi:MAG: pentapeptide repeat-containing protein [Pseudomonadota bacterium]
MLVATARLGFDLAASLAEIRGSGQAGAVLPLAHAFALILIALASLLLAPVLLFRTWTLHQHYALALRQASAAEARTASAADIRFAERFAKATEQLGSQNQAARLGAIYALDQIARDSQAHVAPVVETLCAFVRVSAPGAATPKPLPPWNADLSRDPSQEDATFIDRFGRRPFSQDNDLSRWLDVLPQPAADTRAALSIILRQASAAQAGEGQPPIIDLRGAYLVGATLSGARLSKAIFAGARLERADFSSAELERADLSGAHLAEADLSEAHLSNATLTAAHLEKADLRWANLEGADLAEAHLEAAVLVEANLKRANARGAQLHSAVLRGCVVEGITLRGARLEAAVLTRARLEGADLRGARLTAVDAAGADFEDAILVGARLEGANLKDAYFEASVLRGAMLGSSDLTDATMARASLRSADLSDVQNLDADAILAAFGVKAGLGLTRLPEGLAAPEHWFDAANDGSWETYEAAYRTWLGEDDAGTEA